MLRQVFKKRVIVEYLYYSKFNCNMGKGEEKMRIDPISNERPSSPWDLYKDYKRSLEDAGGVAIAGAVATDGTGESAETKRANSVSGCQTCKNRKYQDGSNDPGVSYKTPTKISAENAASAVRSHESEHVSREQGKAKREGREVVSQSVVLHNSICPECGRSYVSGGTTTTTTRGKSEPQEQKPQKGRLDTKV